MVRVGYEHEKTDVEVVPGDGHVPYKGIIHMTPFKTHTVDRIKTGFDKMN